MKPFINSIAILSLAALFSCEKNPYGENNTLIPNGIGLTMTKTQTDIAEGFNAFGLDLFRELNTSSNYQNAFFSPFSMENALLLATAGEDESTENYKEMMQVLGQKGQDRKEVLGTYKMLHDGFAGMDRYTTFVSVNSAWVNSDICQSGFSGTYESLVKDNLGADLFNRSFSKDNATSQINDWVADKTAGKIQNILDDIGSSSAVLVNALLLDGSWNNIFFKEEDGVLEFKGLAGKGKTVPSLGTVTYLDANENNEYQACRFLLGNSTFAVTMIVPKKDFKDFAKSFNNNKWSSIYKGLYTHEVTAHVPVFTESSSHDELLIPALYKMGMTKAFSSGGYTQILDNGMAMKIEAIVQKAEMDFNKNGITAAAATAISMDTSNFGKKPEYQKMTFNADKPFIYIISETSTNTILFAGIKTEI